jgi:DNA-binding CsgD family transcriptional regulator
LTYRTGEALPIAMRDTLASLQRGAATHLLELEPLSDFEMRALLRNAVEGRRQSVAMRLDELSALAEGNPLVAEELVRSLLAGDGSRPADLPVSEREAVLRRYDALPPQDRDLLSRAAVIGREFTSEFLARVGRASLDGVIGTVKRAIAASLVVERARGTYAFRHERTRHIILGTLLAEEVRLFHARIASELEAPTSGDVADTVLAHHWWEAGDHARASVYAERWGDAAAAAGAFDDAARAYERVDRHEANAGSVGAFALKYGEALHFAGRAEDAAQYATQAFEAFASAGDPSTIRALLLRSAVADDLGDAASALSDAKRAFDLATANDGDDDLRFRAATLLALAGEAADDSAIVAVRAEAARRGDVRTFRDIDVRLALRRTATAMKSDALREARVHFDAAVAAAAGDPRARRRLHASGAALGAAFEAVRAPDDALAVYRAAECDDADRLDVPVRNRQGRTRDELTKREREVAERVAQGKSNKTIGAELFVSERTVEDHVGAMLRKLSLKNRAELAARIARDQPSPDRAT